MDDFDDTSSETSDIVIQHDELDDIPVFATPLVQDLTDEDKFLSDEGSLSSLILKDGPPEIKPRPYQLEMFEESLKRNVIVAVCSRLLQWVR